MSHLFFFLNISWIHVPKKGPLPYGNSPFPPAGGRWVSLSRLSVAAICRRQLEFWFSVSICSLRGWKRTDNCGFTRLYMWPQLSITHTLCIPWSPMNKKKWVLRVVLLVWTSNPLHNIMCAVDVVDGGSSADDNLSINLYITFLNRVTMCSNKQIK